MCIYIYNLITLFHTSRVVVWDFSHQQYHRSNLLGCQDATWKSFLGQMQESELITAAPTRYPSAPKNMGRYHPTSPLHPKDDSFAKTQDINQCQAFFMSFKGHIALNFGSVDL